MNKNDDLVVGAITNYDWKAISPWVNSLERSGYTGNKAMLCYNVSYDVVEKLTDRNFTVFTFGKDDDKKQFYYKQNFSIVVERFFHMWYFLKEMKGKYRYLLTTDVKDVVFQKDPSLWLENGWDIGPSGGRSDGKKILVASESIRYKDENWGRQNFNDAFGPIIYETVKDNVIVNAGTFSGHFDYMVDLFLHITQFSLAGMHTIHNPDQAALNFLVSMESWKSLTHVAPSESGYAAQLGTTMDPAKINAYRPFLVEPTPQHFNACVTTSKGTPTSGSEHTFTIVHQYDRVPLLREAVLARYGD